MLLCSHEIVKIFINTVVYSMKPSVTVVLDLVFIVVFA